MTTLIDTTNTTNLVYVARAAADRLRPSASAHDVSGEISPSAFDMLRRLGITSALVPGQHGGRGVTHRDMGAIVRELGRADPAVAVTLSMHSHLVAAQVWRHHRGMDASAVFERVVNGAILVSTGASDWVGSNGTARKVEGGYQVNARKSPASGCEVGDGVGRAFYDVVAGWAGERRSNDQRAERRGRNVGFQRRRENSC
jgi:acyl-CoA dehydrogenase